VILCALLLLLLAAFSMVPAQAARHTVAGWTMEQGLPHNLVQAVAQGSDGFIWLGTWEGVVRFNGRAFTVFDSQNTPGAELSGVAAILAEPDGAMLFGTINDGVYRYQRGSWEPIGGAAGRDLPINALQRDATGTLWVASGERLLRLDPQGELQQAVTTPHLPEALITSLVQDGGDGLLVGTERGVYQLRNGRLAPWKASAGWLVRDLVADDTGGWLVAADDGVHWLHKGGHWEHLFPGERVDRVRRDAEGALWLSLSAGRLERYADDERERIQVPGQVSPALTIDREGLVWAGSTDGLYRVDRGAAGGLTRADGLGSEYTRAITQTDDGSVWIGHSEGLDRLRSDQLSRVRLLPGDGRDTSVLALAAIPGGLWAGTYNEGVWRLDTQGNVQQRLTLPGVVQPLVRALLADADGSLWVGAADGLYHRSGNEIRHYGAEQGLPGEVVHALYRDASGVLWIGTNNGMASMDSTGKLRTWVADEGFPARYVFDFLGDGNGDLWIASDHGLLRKRGLDITVFDHRKGLPRDKIFRILDDRKGHLWLSSNQGVFRLDRNDLVAVAAGASSQLAVQVIDHTDGMPSSQNNGASTPAGWLTRDGQLLFPTARGVAMIDPERVDSNVRPRKPPVVIEDVVVDGEARPLHGAYRLPHHVERIAVAYAGLGFQAPDKMRYRYRLEGFDAEWVEAGSRTEAVYTNLAPGRYRLRVQAMTLPLDWDDRQRVGEAELSLEVAAPYWRRQWVLALAAAGLAGLVALLVAWRTASFRRRQRMLNTEIAARTQELSEKNRALEQAGMERDGLMQRLEYLAMHDALTGLPNRRAADAHLQKALHEAVAKNVAMNVALLDIDHFKLINDRYGHEAGDQVLCDVASLLRLLLGTDQFVSRHGGEEFLIVLCGVPLQTALEQLQDLRQRIARLRLDDVDPELRITASIGVASFGPGQEAPHVILSAADRALYRAKNEGRNRVRH